VDTRSAQASASHVPLVQEVVGLWVQMQSRLQAHFTTLAAEHSLSAIQAKVLLQLDPATPVTMRALAGRLQYDPSNLTGVIDRLEALGAVRRQPDPKDRRVKGLILTPAGVRMRDPFWHRLISDAGPLGHLSAVQLRDLRAILQSALGEQPAAPAAGQEEPAVREASAGRHEPAGRRAAAGKDH
jgi:DNA-binding MarR family transcriptional regulator